LVRDYDTVVMEGLNVKDMLTKKLGDNKRSLRRSLMSVRFGTLLKVISEVAKIATQRLVLVDPKLTLWDRIYKCWNCKLKLDRDVNSARNILNSEATSSIGTCP